MAAEALAWILSQLDRKISASYLYTDSLVVLGYIQNCDRRFSKFVSRRVNAIINLTKAEQWHYVPTDMNPGDIASRPNSCEDLSMSIWFSGPEFLWTGAVPAMPTESRNCNLPEIVEEPITLRTEAKGVTQVSAKSYNIPATNKSPSKHGQSAIWLNETKQNQHMQTRAKSDSHTMTWTCTRTHLPLTHTEKKSLHTR